jgi:SSS family solute:Na+ symporter
MHVATIDWLIIAVGFLSFLAMAIYVNSKCRTVADYLVSGRKVRVWLGLGSGIAGEIGLLAIVSVCEQGYGHGFSFVLIGILSMLVTVPLFGVFGFGIERFRASKAMSVPQYIEMRYSRRLRILTGMSNCLAGVIQMCLFPIVGASFVRVLIGAPKFAIIAGANIPSDWIIMAILLICPIIFTFLGGYTTLIVTNFFQSILIMVALCWLLFLLISKIGLQNYWTGLEQAHGMAGLNPFAETGNSYGATWFIWMNVMTILLQFSYGPYLQKYASMDKPKTASRSYLFGSLFGNGRVFIILGIGVAVVGVLGKSTPAGIVATTAAWQNMATPYYLSKVVPPVLMGVLLLALLFADIAVTDTYILSWSTSIVNDCIYPFKKQPFTSSGQIMAVRITIVILCVIFFMFGTIYQPTMAIWDFMWLTANIIGGTGIAMLLGMYWKRATTASAYVAVLTCLILPIADLVARRVHLRLHPGADFPLSPQTTGLYTYVLAAVLMIIISLLSAEKTKYWDLGQTVRDMNDADKTAEAAN